MEIETRKVYIDFLASHKCQLTTPFKQRTMNLKHGDVVDLINLEKINGKIHPPAPFYGKCCEMEADSMPYLIMEVYASIDPQNNSDFWGGSSLYQKNDLKLFKGKIYKK